MTITGIYKITNSLNGKMYIGQTIDMGKRKKEHFKSLSSGIHFNKYLQNAFDKYGSDAFSFDVIEVCDVSALNEKEYNYIAKNKTMNRLYGYNLRSGGDKEYLSIESRKKISDTRKERIKSGIIKMIPNVLTDASKLQMSVSSKNRFKDINEHIKLSNGKSTIDAHTVTIIKMMLYMDMSIKEIALITNTSTTKIIHISRLNSFGLVCSELNEYIINRYNINRSKFINNIINDYKNGMTYKNMAGKYKANIRTMIRICTSNKTLDDTMIRKNIV